MFETVLLVIVSITTFIVFKLTMELLLGIDFKVSNYSSAILTLITIAYVSNASFNLIIFYFFELIILVIILWYFNRKKKDKFVTNRIYLSIFIYFGITLVAALITMINVDSNRKNEKEQLAIEKKQEQEIINFKKQYLFDVDSLGNSIKMKKYVEENSKIQKPLIIYTKIDSSDFDFSIIMNKKIDTTYKSYNIDNINTIVVLENSESYKGSYSNHVTDAMQREVYIYFVDRRSLKLLKQLRLEGTLPPSTISYSRKFSTPKVEYGSSISEEEILQNIMNEVKE